MCHARLHKKLVRVLLGFRLGLGVRDSVGGLVFVVTPPHTVTVTQDLDSRQQHLDTHLDGSPELLVRNEFVTVMSDHCQQRGFSHNIDVTKQSADRICDKLI